MTLTPEIITMVVTALVTALFGELAKKFNWSTKDYIPFQNLAIGLFAGVLLFITGLNTNLLSAVILSLFASLCAGGTYDLTQMKGTKKDVKEEEEWDKEKE